MIHDLLYVNTSTEAWTQSSFWYDGSIRSIWKNRAWQFMELVIVLRKSGRIYRQLSGYLGEHETYNPRAYQSFVECFD